MRGLQTNHGPAGFNRGSGLQAHSSTWRCLTESDSVIAKSAHCQTQKSPAAHGNGWGEWLRQVSTSPRAYTRAGVPMYGMRHRGCLWLRANLAVCTRAVNAVNFCIIGEIRSSTTHLTVGGANEFAKRYPS